MTDTHTARNIMTAGRDTANAEALRADIGAAYEHAMQVKGVYRRWRKIIHEMVDDRLRAADSQPASMPKCQCAKCNSDGPGCAADSQPLKTADGAQGDEVERHPDGRPVFAYIGWPKNRERFYLDIIYPNTTRIEDEYDYRPLYAPPPPPSDAVAPVARCNHGVIFKGGSCSICNPISTHESPHAAVNPAASDAPFLRCTAIRPLSSPLEQCTRAAHHTGACAYASEATAAPRDVTANAALRVHIQRLVNHCREQIDLAESDDWKTGVDYVVRDLELYLRVLTTPPSAAGSNIETGSSGEGKCTTASGAEPAAAAK